MKIVVHLTGTSPLLMHNPQMVDPDFDLNRQIKEITAKRKKTDADLREIERLEWYGGIYLAHDEAGKPIVVQPSSKVRKSLVNTARITKQGKQVERALSFNRLHIPLAYKGPAEIDAIFAEKTFHSRLSVGVQGKRIMRVRPSFFPWALTLDGIFIEDAGLNKDDLVRIVEIAGLVEGIGDNRVNGYGRFEGTVQFNA